MTILDNPTRAQYTATSAQTEFIYNFEIFDQNDLDVYSGETLLAIGTDYTVSGVNVETGGTVTLTTGATAGDIITIERNMALSRDSDYATSGDYTAEQVNTDLDKLWAAIQQLKASNDLTVSLPTTTTATLPAQLPNAAADNVLGWDSTGSIIENKTLTELSVGIQALIDTGLDVVRNSITPQTANGSVAINRPQLNAIQLTGTDTYTGNISRVVNAVYPVNFANANTGAVTIDTESVVKKDGSALLAGEVSGDHHIKWDGTNFVVLDPAFNKNYILNSASLKIKTLIPTTAGGVTSIYITPDETRLFFIGVDGANRYVYQIDKDVSGNWVYNSVRYDLTTNVAASTYETLTFNGSGTRLYIVSSVEIIYQLDLSTGFDLATVSNSSNSFDASSLSPVIAGLACSHAGDALFFYSSTNHVFNQLNLSTADDLSTAADSGDTYELDIGSIIQGLALSSSGKNLIVLAESVETDVGTYTNIQDWVYTIDLITPNQISSAQISTQKLILDRKQSSINTRHLSVALGGRNIYCHRRDLSSGSSDDYIMVYDVSV